MAKLVGKNALICGDSRTIMTKKPLPFDATGYDIRFTVRQRGFNGSTDDSNAVIALTSGDGSISVDENNVLTIELSGSDTRVNPGKYIFDIQFVSPEGKVSSTRAQEIEFIADVTKET